MATLLLPGSVSITTGSSTVKNNYPHSFDNVVSDVQAKQNTVGYWKKKSEGVILPVNTYTRYVTNGSRSHFRVSGNEQCKILTPAGIWRSSRWDFALSATPLYGTQLLLAGYKPDVVNYVANRAFSNFMEDEINTKFDTLAFAGEGKKTANMVFQAANFGYQTMHKLVANRSGLVEDIKKRYIKLHQSGRTRDFYGRQLVDDMTNLYLEIFYGWQPALYSINDAASAWESFQKKDHRRSLYGGSQHKEEVVQKVRTAGPFSCCKTIDYSVIRKINVKVKYGSKFIEHPSSASASELLGLTTKQIPASMWELMRFSFIADYFSNLGSFITAIGYDPGSVDSTTLYKNIKIEESHKFQFEGVSSNTGSASRTYFAQGTGRAVHLYKAVYFNRVPVASPNVISNLSLRMNPDPFWTGVANSVLIAGKLGWNHFR